MKGSKDSNAVKKRQGAKGTEESVPLNAPSAEDALSSHRCSSVSFFAWVVLQTVLVHCISGALFGYGIGFVGPYYTLYRMGNDCSSVTSHHWCPLFIPDKCKWEQDECVFSVDNCATQSKEVCSAGGFRSEFQMCHWNVKKGICEPVIGFTALQNGLFAGTFIVGGCIGSLLSVPLLSTSGHKTTFLLCGLVATLGSVITHLATYTNSYVLLIAGRLFTGVAAGVLCVSSPAYVEETAPAQHRQLVGVFFQIACTFAILMASVMGLGLAQKEFSTQKNMQIRRQLLCLPGTVIALLITCISRVMRESVVWLEQRRVSGKGERFELQTSDDESIMKNAPTLNDPKPGWRRVKGPLLTALVLCVAQQLTGMNAIMNYAPVITGRMGLEPLFGNFVVMSWNFVTVLASIPLSSRVAADRAYKVAVLLASLSCLLVGVAVLPTFDFGSTLKMRLSAIGILLFIAFFELGMGSFFWNLSQSIFPPDFCHQGSSFTILVQFLINIVINVGFPLAVECLSGGPSGDQDVGMGITFLFFGTVGLVSTAYLFKYLHPWQST